MIKGEFIIPWLDTPVKIVTGIIAVIFVILMLPVLFWGQDWMFPMWTFWTGLVCLGCTVAGVIEKFIMVL